MGWPRDWDQPSVLRRRRNDTEPARIVAALGRKQARRVEKLNRGRRGLCHPAERLQGFDTRFSPWGFEDDDFTLRATLLGMHNRVAEDVFVRHVAYSSGERAARHEQLLDENWRKFADKWSLPRTARRGDYAGLEAALARGS